jgi:hypothetical protein
MDDVGIGNSRAHAHISKDAIDLADLGKITDRFGGIDQANAANPGYEILPGES